MNSILLLGAGSWLRLLIAIASLGLPSAGACADSSAGVQSPIERIRALIGDAACDDDSQCRTIAIGTRACGGPEYYLAWSTKRTDPALLIDAVTHNDNVHRPTPPRPGVRSTCVLVTDPGAYCATDGGTTGGDRAQWQGRTCRLRNAQQAGRGPVD
ncbi:MAG TPA: hypothetical protein PLW68_14445 [Casimicrobiaceae bacterium]|nr:hypothetical protein [Casimicrobiaceae bacterium]